MTYLSSTEKRMLNSLKPETVKGKLVSIGWQPQPKSELPKWLEGKDCEILSKDGGEVLIVYPSHSDWQRRMTETVFNAALAEDMSIFEMLCFLSVSGDGDRQLVDNILTSFMERTGLGKWVDWSMRWNPVN